MDLEESQTPLQPTNLKAAFARTAVSKDTSPVKEKLAKMRRMIEEPAQASGGSSASSSNPVLEAIEALSAKMDKMALKSDLDKMELNMKTATKMSIAEAVDPLKSEIHDLSSRLDTVEHQIASGPTSPQRPQAPPRVPDPAVKQIAFVGWPDSTSAAERFRKIEEFLAENAKGFRAVSFDNVYKGPYNDRKLTKVAYAEFASSDSRREALNSISGKSLSVQGQTISIKNARTKVNGQRNYALRKAKELLKASDVNTGKTVEIKWAERCVSVNDVAAFSQAKTDISGSFLPPYSAMSLP